MHRIVIDTVVFVRSLLNPRSIWGSLIFEHYQDYRLVVSKPVVVELLEVLSRPELVSLFRFLERMDKNWVLDLVSQAEAVDLTEIPAVTRDPKDDKFLATAIKGGAEYLVTEDRDLLDLQTHEGIVILTTSQFLEMLKREKSNAA